MAMVCDTDVVQCKRKLVSRRMAKHGRVVVLSSSSTQIKCILHPIPTLLLWHQRLEHLLITKSLLPEILTPSNISSGRPDSSLLLGPSENAAKVPPPLSLILLFFWRQNLHRDAVRCPPSPSLALNVTRGDELHSCNDRRRIVSPDGGVFALVWVVDAHM